MKSTIQNCRMKNNYNTDFNNTITTINKITINFETTREIGNKN